MSNVSYLIKLLGLSLFLFQFSLETCQVQRELDCQDFKNGVFEMESNGILFSVEREDDYQIEKSIHGYSKFNVTWTSDCDYVLKLYETDMELMSTEIGQEFLVTITSTDENSFSYLCRVKGRDFEVEGTYERVRL